MPESKLFKEISSLSTEQINPNSVNIDVSKTIDILRIINNEDKKIAPAIEDELPNIEKAVDGIVKSFKNGGKLYYFGAGTSGRLGILDASECPPTFGTEPELVQGYIAGGKDAVFVAKEGAEDNPQNGIDEVNNIGISENDIVCGLAASGRTPYVIGALKRGKELGAFTILVTTAGHSKIKDLNIEADVVISPDVGPEVVAGSTRMKSGTAQKLVLNMLTTTAMVKMGKTFGNVMVDLKQSNNKLRERSKKIIMTICDVNYDEAANLLEKSGHHVKTAIVMSLLSCSREEAQKHLSNSEGFIKKAVKDGRE